MMYGLCVYGARSRFETGEGGEGWVVNIDQAGRGAGRGGRAGSCHKVLPQGWAVWYRCSGLVECLGGLVRSVPQATLRRPTQLPAAGCRISEPGLGNRKGRCLDGT